jgi:hypothetical protein
MLKHFVVTRLGLGIYSEPWLARIIDLFEAVTLPSLLGQTSAEFVWLIAIDAQMPSTARHRIEDLRRSSPRCHLVPIDVTRLERVRQGCFDWVWDHCQEYILEGGLLDDPCDYVTTSVIDADDAWHREVIATVNRFMWAWLPRGCVGEADRGTWLRHTSGIAATFPRGYTWFVEDDALEPMHYPFMSMAVFVTARFSSGISACSSRHRGWPSYCDVLAFEVSEIEPDRPMWIYARHDLTTQPWDASTARPADASTRAQLGHDFGIDPWKVARWRRPRPGRGEIDAPASAHHGCDASARYDRIFRIAALNRQIAALRRRRERPGETGVRGVRPAPDDEAIAAKEARRASLIERLRAGD